MAVRLWAPVGWAAECHPRYPSHSMFQSLASPAMPTVLRIGSARFFFYSNEELSPRTSTSSKPGRWPSSGWIQ